MKWALQTGPFILAVLTRMAWYKDIARTDISAGFQVKICFKAQCVKKTKTGSKDGESIPAGDGEGPVGEHAPLVQARRAHHVFGVRPSPVLDL